MVERGGGEGGTAERIEVTRANKEEGRSEHEDKARGRRCWGNGRGGHGGMKERAFWQRWRVAREELPDAREEGTKRRGQ